MEPGWPKRAIRFIVSAPAGSAGDTVCRILGEKLGERLGQQFVLENRSGASGTIAGEALARSTADGYTIGLVTTSTHAVAAVLSPNLPYDPVADIALLAMIGRSPYVLAVHPELPVKSVSELVALAKTKPRQLSNGVFGTMSLGYLAWKLSPAHPKR